MGKSLLEGDFVLAIDFDGTISTEPDMGKELILQPECARVLSRLYEDGARLILWTCRSGPALDEACEFLRENDLLHLFEAINDQLVDVYEKYYPHVGRKVGADFYVDDKNIGFTVDWVAIENLIYGEDE